MLFLFCNFSLRVAAWCLKVNRPSKMIPSIFGFRSVGTGAPLMVMGSWIASSLLKVVNSVAEDLDGEMSRFLSVNQVLRVSRYMLIVELVT